MQLNSYMFVKTLIVETYSCLIAVIIMQGHVLRLAMVLEAANHALEGGTAVTGIVQATSMQQAIAVMRHLDGGKLNVIGKPQREGEKAKEVSV